MDEHVQPQSATRNPPEIIRIPPNSRSPYAQYKWVAIISLSFTAVVAIPITLAQGAVADCLTIIGILVVLAVFVGLGLRVGNRRYERKYRNFVSDHAGDLVEVSERDATNDWHYATNGEPQDLLNKILKRYPEPSDRARVVCTGFIELPEIKDYAFEPRILTASDRMWSDLLYSIPAAFVGIAILVGALTKTSNRLSLSGIFYVISAIGGTGLAWFWRTLIRPDYVRLAPGIVQFMQYKYKESKPIIRTYMMEAGTSVIVRGRLGSFAFTFKRDTDTDLLDLSGTWKRAEALESVWRAILSTMPIPQLPEDDLLA